MRIPAISLQSAAMRSMPSIDPIARVQKRAPTEGIGKSRAATSTGRSGTSSLKNRSRNSARRGSWDGLGQEVDLLV